MKKNRRTIYKVLAILFVSTVIITKLNNAIFNIIKNCAVSNIELICIFEIVALVITIIGIVTDNYKRMFFGFGSYYMYIICGTIIQILSAGQTMKTDDKINLFIDFFIIIVLALAEELKPLTTAVIVGSMVALEMIINISLVASSVGTHNYILELANTMTMLAVGEAVVVACSLVKNNRPKKQKPKHEII